MTRPPRTDREATSGRSTDRVGGKEGRRGAAGSTSLSYLSFLLISRHTLSHILVIVFLFSLRNSAAIFYHNDAQKREAEERVAAETKRLGKQVVTEVVSFTKWWPAEEYHQRYLEKGGQVKIQRLQEAESSFADDGRVCRRAASRF